MSQELNFINDSLHRLTVVARIAVEDGQITKDEIGKFIVDTANKEFVKVFDATEDAFFEMCLKDMLTDLLCEEMCGFMKGDVQ